MNVEKPSISAHKLFNIRGFTLERNLMSAVTVESHSVLVYPLFSIGESILEKNLMAVMSGKTFSQKGHLIQHQ